ncbi:death-associated inhibitor of apoptosis 1-like [Saccostrea echinata]|uniref:death-associated inhibitor of apoptosis 1-like n=1 Tax=Saccostrea echinata TaxID=191078 RepID=UPI002A833EE4|nr:death-associated inhibitor of apoptosis 1-like [Saccostrea echinata]
MDPANKDIIPTSPLERFKPLQENFQKRLKTFSKYPKNAVKEKEDLADNGFHYIGNGKDDKVQCTFCGIIMNNWEEKDDIQSEHRRFSPSCSRVLDNDRKNFGANLDGGLSRLDFIRNTQNAAENGAIPQMKDYNLRMKSFNDWSYSDDEKPSIDALAKAGLFYTGKNDTTQCWFCGNLLEEWEPEDKPKEEHDANFPKCMLAAH